MNYTRKILLKESTKSNGRAMLVRAPDERRPSADSLSNLEKEISAQINANESMRNRSVQNAEGQFCGSCSLLY